MVFARFVPMLRVLAVAGALAGKRVAPAGPGTMRTDTPTFVVLLVGVSCCRRAAHLLPRPPARTGRPEPDRPALLMHARPREPPPIAVVVLTVALRPRLPARHDRRRAGRVPGQGRRLEDRARRQGRRLAADRPGLLEATREPTSRAGPSRDRATTRPATLLHQPRAQQQDLARPVRGLRSTPTWSASAATPRPDRRPRSRSTRSRARPRASIRTSPRPTPASRRTASRACATCRSSACSS